MKKLSFLFLVFLLFIGLTSAIAGGIPIRLSVFRPLPVTLTQNPVQLTRSLQLFGSANLLGYTANLINTAERSGAIRSVNMHVNLRNAGLIQDATSQFGIVSTPVFAEKVFLGQSSLSQLSKAEMKSFVFASFMSQLLEGTVVPSTEQIQNELEMLSRYMKEKNVVGGDISKHFAQVWGAASYIGLLGSKESGAEILALAKEDYGELNPYVDYYATRILLNLEAYDELRALAKFRLEKTGMFSSVWRSIKEEMSKRGEELPINATNIVGTSPIVPNSLQQAQVFQDPYMVALGDPSAEITAAYLEIREGLEEKFNQAAATFESDFTGEPIVISPQQIPDIADFYDADYSNNAEIQAEQLYSFVYEVTEVANRLVASKVFNLEKLVEYATKELPKVEETGYHFPGEISLGLENFIDTERFMRTRRRTFEYEPIILNYNFQKQDLEKQLQSASEHILKEKPYLLEEWKDMNTDLALPVVFIYDPAYHRTDFWEAQVGRINYYSISHIFVYLKAQNRPAGWYRVSGSRSELTFTPVGRIFQQ